MDSKEKERIIQWVSERINLEHIKFLIWYGNLIGNDIDLMAVLERETRVRLYEPSKLDILTIGKGEFERRLKLLDPVTTEPVITGFLVMGDEAEFSELRSDAVLSLSLSAEAIKFLKRRARERLRNAQVRLQVYEQKGDRDSLISYLTHLSFACSYHDFAGYYGDDPKFLPITFKHLLVLDGKPVLKEVMGILEEVKSGKECGENQLVGLFEKTQKWLRVVS